MATELFHGFSLSLSIEQMKLDVEGHFDINLTVSMNIDINSNIEETVISLILIWMSALILTSGTYAQAYTTRIYS